MVRRLFGGAMAGVYLLSLVACNGEGGGMASLPPIAQNVSRTQSSTATTPPAVTGTIAGVSGKTINMQGGPGCGYVNVTYDSSTQINYNGHTLSAGTQISVWGSGSCASSFTATQISLGSGATPAPSATPSGSATPSPVPSSAPVVAGVIGFINSSSQFTIQGGPGCGYVNINHGSSTQIIYNGSTLALGAYAKIWGSGNCATSFTATTISLGTGSAPSPSATPVPAPSGAPTVAGAIYSINSPTQFTIYGGAGCGHVNINYSSSTPIATNGYALSLGTYVQVWGSGNCATSFTANAISLGTNASTPSPAPTATARPTPTPTIGGGAPSHIVIVLDENHDYSDIIGNSAAPYINSLVSQGRLFTNYFAVSHPSQPNYVAIYSGSTQGYDGSDNCPAASSLGATSLGGELKNAGISITGYVEGSGGSLADCNHTPWEFFADSKGVESDFSNFPTNYASLPQVAFVIPNINDDMHNGTIQQGDTWLRQHLDAYAQWAKNNNSLLIVTWDEDRSYASNQVAAFMVGSGVTPGSTDGTLYSHYSVTRFIEQLYKLPYLANAASATPLGGWSGSP